MIRASVVRTKQGMSLVEWKDEHGLLQRHWVTQSMIVSGDKKTVMVREPRQGIPYGIDFAHVISPSVTPEHITQELRKRGLWTYADLQARPQEVISALQSAYGIDLSAIIRAAREYERHTEE